MRSIRLFISFILILLLVLQMSFAFLVSAEDETGGGVTAETGVADDWEFEHELINKTLKTEASYASITFNEGYTTIYVACTKACAVLARISSEEYIRLEAVEYDENVYSFDLSGLADGYDLIIALKGDANMDGYINSTDLGQARGVMSMKLEPTMLQLLVMDLHVNGTYNSTDLGQLRAMMSGKLKLQW